MTLWPLHSEMTFWAAFWLSQKFWAVICSSSFAIAACLPGTSRNFQR